MADYIDRHKAIGVLEEIRMRYHKAQAVDKESAAHRCIVAVSMLTTSDVAPLVHGKWLDEDFPEKMATVHGFAICSACGKLSHKAEHGYNILSNYCPNCGARMDGTEVTDERSE